jgi:hypothetical protein
MSRERECFQLLAQSKEGVEVLRKISESYENYRLEYCKNLEKWWADSDCRDSVDVLVKYGVEIEDGITRIKNFENILSANPSLFSDGDQIRLMKRCNGISDENYMNSDYRKQVIDGKSYRIVML